MVDTTVYNPSDPRMTSGTLIKVLLGAMDKDIDNISADTLGSLA
jgi:hypothetical protein